MKQKLFVILSALFGAVLTIGAKKVKLTIDGVVSPNLTTLYLIVNEDTAHAQIVPIKDEQFSVTITVDAHAFVRLDEDKGMPERCLMVLVPDSRHITVNLRSFEIKGSPMSKRLNEAINKVREASPEGFHIDVFDEDPKAWEEARVAERSMREQMLKNQRNILKDMIMTNKFNNIPAWLVFCNKELFEGELEMMTRKPMPKWRKHPILKIEN